MPWTVGVDEAGYGPNLGPLVMTSVACRVPEALACADLWQALCLAVRRAEEKRDRRLLVADSKVVYAGARGMMHLETGVLTCAAGAVPATVAQFLEALCPSNHPELREECWYLGTTALPVATAAEQVAAAGELLAGACKEAGLALGPVRSVVVCPARFNALLDRWGSKGIVLALALAELLRVGHDPDAGAEPVSFFIDKHGGRNHYAALLQQALPGGLVSAEEEGAERSAYRVVGLRRPVRVTFEPRADAGHFCVALASMVSKYLRELLMLEFNQFWQRHVPGLKPTAGYPVDAARFFADIRPAAERLGIPEAALWRRK